MNRFSANFGGSGEAKLRYLQNDYEVIKSGRYVICAVSKAQISLEELHYWDAERQEAYASSDIATKRYIEGRETS